MIPVMVVYWALLRALIIALAMGGADCVGWAAEVTGCGLFSRESVPDGVHAAFRRVCSGGVIATRRDATLLKTPGTIVELQLAAPCARAEWYHYGAGVSVHRIGCVRRR